MSIIKGDSMLSNLSNISVVIGNRPGDGSEIFKFPRNNELLDIDRSDTRLDYKVRAEYEVKIDDLSHQEYGFQDTYPQPPPPDPNLMGSNQFRLNPFFYERSPNYMFMPHSIMPFMPQPQRGKPSWTGNERQGVSQEQSVSGSQQIRNEEQKSAAMLKRIKNETKNIPKNYGKAIISFIEKYRQIVLRVCEASGVPYDDFSKELLERKRSINTIADLRELWISYKYAKCMRIVSNLFLRKYSLNYIFNSRICNFKSHVKYRYRLCEAIKNPKAFKHIKDY